jgi:protein-disulfide isomerase
VTSSWPWRTGLPALLALALTACQRPAADDEAFGQRVRAYLLAHPDVLEEVSERLDAKQSADAAAARGRARSLLPGLRSAVEHDPQDFVANPKGAITVTEFYDYRCPHCANAAPKVIALVRANPDVRFVFKETPIFGATSEHAARAALAVARAGGDSLGLYQAFMSDPALDDAVIDRLALRKGARAEDLAGPAAKAADAHLARTGDLFARLDLEGTPAFIVGDDIILGEHMGAVEAAVAKARTSLATRRAGA